MSLDSIQQQARTLLETYKLYAQLQQQRSDPQVAGKLQQMRQYIRGLSRNIQHLVEEEKQNAS